MKNRIAAAGSPAPPHSAGALCRRPRIGREPQVLGRDEAERRALEVLRLRIAGLVPKARRLEKFAEIFAERGRERGH